MHEEICTRGAESSCVRWCAPFCSILFHLICTDKRRPNQVLAKRRAPGLANFVLLVAYHSCLALPRSKHATCGPPFNRACGTGQLHFLIDQLTVRDDRDLVCTTGLNQSLKAVNWDTKVVRLTGIVSSTTGIC